MNIRSIVGGVSAAALAVSLVFLFSSMANPQPTVRKAQFVTPILVQTPNGGFTFNSIAAGTHAAGDISMAFDDENTLTFTIASQKYHVPLSNVAVWE